MIGIIMNVRNLVPVDSSVNSADFESDNSFTLWFTGMTEAQPAEVESSEEYMGYPVGYQGSVYN